MVKKEAVEGFCLKCRARKSMIDIILTTMGNGTPALRGECPDCRTRIYKLLPKRKREENRRSSRINCELTLKFRRLKTEGLSEEEMEYHDGLACDISTQGMHLEVPFDVSPGQLLDIYAMCQNPVAASVGIAKVIWHKELSGKHHIGIDFVLKQQI